MAVLSNVKVLFSNVSKEDKFSQKFQVVVNLTEDQAADAEAEGLKVATKEHNGETQYQVKFKTQFAPRVVDVDGQTDYDLRGGEIGRGSEVSVQYKERPWTNPTTKQKGTSFDLQAVQILSMVEDVKKGAMEFEAAGSVAQTEF